MTTRNQILDIFFRFFKGGINEISYSEIKEEYLVDLLETGFKYISDGTTPVVLRIQLSTLKSYQIKLLSMSQNAEYEIGLIEFAYVLLTVFHQGRYIDILDIFHEYGDHYQKEKYIPALENAFKDFI